jgi:uncharacterized protein
MSEVQQSSMADVTPEPIAAELDPWNSAALQPVDPAYPKVMRIGIALSWLPLMIGAVAVDALVMPEIDGPVGLVTALVWFAALLSIVLLPARRYERLGYVLGSEDLRVARGYFFRIDTIVPFVRVQHIDVGQGVIERRYGLSHLIVHTSGTHNSTVTLPGLPAASAAEMRDAIRAHIRSDFA